MEALVSDGAAIGSWQVTSASWGYVTPEGEDLSDGDFDGDGDVDGDDLGVWEAGLPQADGNEDGQIDEADYQVWLENAGPKVKNVTLSRPGSTDPAYDFDDVVGNGEQLRTVPVGAVNQIAVQFTKDVDISSGDLEFIALNRVVTEPTVSSFDPPTSGNGYTATWTLSAPLPGAQYLLRLADSIEDFSGNALDGEWTNPASYNTATTTTIFPSGDNVAGGDFEFVFTILPGDANRDNQVTATDFGIVITNLNDPGTFAWTQGDFNGNGSVTGADYGYLLQFLNKANWQNLSVLGDYDDDYDWDGSDAIAFSTYYNSNDLAADLTGDSVLDSADFDAALALYNFGIELSVLS